MIIDIRNHFKKIQRESNISRKEIEDQVKKAMSYFDIENSLRKLPLKVKKLTLNKSK